MGSVFLRFLFKSLPKKACSTDEKKFWKKLKKQSELSN